MNMIKFRTSFRLTFSTCTFRNQLYVISFKTNMIFTRSNHRYQRVLFSMNTTRLRLYTVLIPIDPRFQQYRFGQFCSTDVSIVARSVMIYHFTHDSSWYKINGTPFLFWRPSRATTFRDNHRLNSVDNVTSSVFFITLSLSFYL